MNRCLGAAFDNQGNFLFQCLSDDSNFIEVNLLDWELKKFHNVSRIRLNQTIKQEGVYDRLGNIYVQGERWDGKQRMFKPLDIKNLSNEESFDSYTLNTSSEIGYAQTKVGSFIAYRGETIFFPELRIVQANFDGYPDSIEILTPDTFWNVRKASLIDWDAASIAGSKKGLKLHDHGGQILLTSDKSYSFLKNGEWITKYIKCSTRQSECPESSLRRFLAQLPESSDALFEPGIIDSTDRFKSIIVDSDQTAWGFYSQSSTFGGESREEVFFRRFNKAGMNNWEPTPLKIISVFQSLAIRDGKLFIFGAKSSAEGYKPVVLAKSLRDDSEFAEENESWEIFRTHSYGEVLISRKGVEVLVDTLADSERSKLILSPLGVGYEIKDGYINRWSSSGFTKLECQSEEKGNIKAIVFDDKDNLLFIDENDGKVKMCLIK
ncbi:MAG: hypothetical protein EOP04_11750 [Proteobacteria bacterium]|nr:MAG: hypothetical protein EOP04_11750 [Pseudomonadota bacterium]